MSFTIEPFSIAPTAADLDDLAAIVCGAVASDASVGVCDTGTYYKLPT